jgi:hypothetical protein
VLENRILSKIFGPKRDKITGVWGKLHLEELNGLSYSFNIFRVIKSRKMSWVGHVARMGRGEACTVFGGEPLWRPRLRWEDNI